MGREKTKEEDVVFSLSPFPSSSALPPRVLPCASSEDEWGRVSSSKIPFSIDKEQMINSSYILHI